MRTRDDGGRRLASACACALLTFGLAACNGSFSEWIRDRTYPPDFNYIPAEKLESTMWQLASQASRLEDLLEEPEPELLRARAEIAALLAAMEETSRALGPAGWPSNHPHISQNVDQFRKRLASARLEVERDPPGHAEARRVTTACLDCHRGR